MVGFLQFVCHIKKCGIEQPHSSFTAGSASGPVSMGILRNAAKPCSEDFGIREIASAVVSIQPCVGETVLRDFCSVGMRRTP